MDQILTDFKKMENKMNVIFFHRFKVILLFIIFLVSCANPPSLIEEKFITSGYDFSNYSKKGFLFTPNLYQGDYETIGLIQLSYTPQAKYDLIRAKQRYGKPPYGWEVDEINPKKAIKAIYKECVEMGADALTQMKIETFFEHQAQDTHSPITIIGIKISGFAIKRIGAFK
jgi:hypothetical protein